MGAASKTLLGFLGIIALLAIIGNMSNRTPSAGSNSSAAVTVQQQPTMERPGVDSDKKDAWGRRRHNRHRPTRDGSVQGGWIE
jgi:hypothetical protein